MGIALFIFAIFRLVPECLILKFSKKYYETSDPTRGDARFHNVLRTVQNFGDYEKLQAGVFENYLKAKYRDSYFESVNLLGYGFKLIQYIIEFD